MSGSKLAAQPQGDWLIVVLVGETVSQTRWSLPPVVQTVLLDVAPPLVAYYGLRAAGVSEYVALITATVVSGLRVSYGVLRTRRLDPFAVYLLLTFGLSLAVGLATTDPRLILVGNTLVNGLGGLVFLGSCVVGTPLTQVVARRFRPPTENAPTPGDAARMPTPGDAARMPTPGDAARMPTPGDAARMRRVHVSLSAMWGVGLLVEVAIRLVVIAHLSVDAANAVNSAITLPVVGLLVIATVIVGRRSAAPATAAA